MSNNLPVAVVDIGTNTFHLLIGQWRDGKLEEIYRERHFVKLAGGGIDTLAADAVVRAKVAAKSLGEAIARHELSQAVAYGTAALRTATNGPELRTELSSLLGVEVQLINGQREAALIAKGVMAAGYTEGNYLIMDIGGGSVEFICVADGVVGFSESYPIGAQVLKQQFHNQEPFGKTQQDALDKHLEQVLAEVRLQLSEPLTLIGASGTFDVLASLYGETVSEALHRISPAKVTQLYTESCLMTDAERMADERIPNDRADMIVVALALIDYWVRRYPSMKIYTCDYALKEGALVELSK